MAKDAIVLLKEDHKEVKKLFAQFEKKNTTDSNRAVIAEKVSELLTVHTYIENEVFYPAVRRLLPDLEDDILESLEEHHVVDLLSVELLPLGPDNERFVPKFKVMMENVRHHIEEEEDGWFPKVREGLTRKQLQELGEDLLTCKEIAPRHPAQPSALKKAVDAVIS